MAKKQDKTEEGIHAVEEALGKTERFIEQNQKILVGVVSVIVVVVLGYFAFQRFYVQPKGAEAQEQMFMAEKYFEKDSLNLALYGDGNYPGFLDIIDDYGMTRSATLSHYYAGIIYLRLGDYEEAIDHLESFSSDDHIVSSMATGAIGDAYMELNDAATAVDYYLDAAETRMNEFTTPLFYMKAGWAYEILEDYEGAKKVYEIIKYEYPASNEAREIDKYISRAAGLAEKS